MIVLRWTLKVGDKTRAYVLVPTQEFVSALDVGAEPYLGITYVPLNPAIAARLGIGEVEGIVIAQVVDASPAAEAGLQPSDVVTEVDGVPLKGESDFAPIVGTHKPGDTLTLTVLRGSEQLSLEITLGEAPAPEWRLQGNNEMPWSPAPSEAAASDSYRWIGRTNDRASCPV